MVGFQTDYKTTFTIHLSKIWKGAFPLENSNNRNPTHLNSIFMDNNVWFIKIRTTHNLPLWLYEYFWIISLFGHLVYFILKVLAWEICIMKWGFAKKDIIKSQRQFMNQTLSWLISLLVSQTNHKFILMKQAQTGPCSNSKH